MTKEINLCKIEGCEGRVKAHGLCPMHYMQTRRDGEIKEGTYSKNQNNYYLIEDFVVIKRNEIIIKKSYSEIVLYTEDDLEFARVTIDTEDIKRVENYLWRIDNDMHIKGYKPSDKMKNNSRWFYIHDLLLNNIDGTLEVDHIDRNPLDNRKENLRLCTSQENKMNRGLRRDNTSGVTGVHYDKEADKWISKIVYGNNMAIQLGRFTDKEEAIKARLEAELKYFKAFAPQIHLFEQYGIVVNT